MLVAAEGLGNVDIAERLGCSAKTVSKRQAVGLPSSG